MKKLLFISTLFLFPIHAAYKSKDKKQVAKTEVKQDVSKTTIDEHAKHILVDQVEAIVDGPKRRHLICQSELERMGIDGRKPTLHDLVVEELVFQDSMGKIPTEGAADKYINTVKKQYNLNDEQVIGIFERSGLTMAEGRKQLEKMYAVNGMLDHKIMGRIFVPEHDVKNYYNEHPVYTEPAYKIQVAIVPYSHLESKDKQKAAIEQTIKKTGNVDASWGEPVWIKESEIAESKRFITTMNSGDISTPQEGYNGFELVRVVEKKEAELVPLEKRYREIATILRKPKYGELKEKYEKELLSNASIAYMSPSTLSELRRTGPSTV